ncbi:MAG: hypothetical protein C0618_11110 [Desulfuromonas sp.]|nr:MAG: hypothetical protein C0618_11110 [Desulfuromonas sp.]
MSDLNIENLPEGWTSARIDKTCDVNPRINKAEISDDLLVSFVPMPAVGPGDGSIDVSQERLASEVKKGFTAFKQGDVLFAKITPCMENGKMAVVPKVTNGYGFGSTEFHVLRPKEGVEARYVYYYVSSQNFRGVAERYMTGAVGQKRVSTTYLKEQKIPLAPPEQQKRIVAEIEKQFSRLDEAVAYLKRVKANLKRYKAAVLKAAVEGKLTEEWRKQHPDVEPADNLLERILAERRESWQGRGKYKEPVAPDATDLPELPEGWVWTCIDTVTDMMSGHAFKKAEYSEDGVRLLQIANVSFGYTKWEEIEHLPEEYMSQWAHLLLKEGDVLMALNRPLLSRELKIAQLGSKDVPAILYQRVGKFLFYVNDVADYFLMFMQSPYYINTLESQLQGVNIPFINKGKLLSTPFPLPISLDEMKVVVDEVSSKLSVLKIADDEIEKNLKRVGRLRQSILKKAFSGELTR